MQSPFKVLISLLLSLTCHTYLVFSDYLPGVGEFSFSRHLLMFEGFDNSPILLRARRELNMLTNSSSIDGDTGNKGWIAAAVIVPIVVIGLVVGGYFLYRWLHMRRATTGKYQPNKMEGTINHIPDQFGDVLKIPPEEKLF